MKKLWAASVCAGAVLLCACSPAGNTGDGQNSGNSEIILATTTSTKDSGLLDEILPVFEKETGYSVSVVSVGSGEAMTMGENGEADNGYSPGSMCRSPDEKEVPDTVWLPPQ